MFLNLVALLAFSESIKYFTHNHSKVYTVIRDASIAFDKVLHSGLFVKLLRKTSKCAWCCYCAVGAISYSVSWNDNINLAIVRQGGVFSPHLFDLYIDERIDSLRLSGMVWTVYRPVICWLSVVCGCHCVIVTIVLWPSTPGQHLWRFWYIVTGTLSLTLLSDNSWHFVMLTLKRLLAWSQCSTVVLTLL